MFRRGEYFRVPTCEPVASLGLPSTSAAPKAIAWNGNLLAGPGAMPLNSLSLKSNTNAANPLRDRYSGYKISPRAIYHRPFEFSFHGSGRERAFVPDGALRAIHQPCAGFRLRELSVIS